MSHFNMTNMSKINLFVRTQINVQNIYNMIESNNKYYRIALALFNDKS